MIDRLVWWVLMLMLVFCSADTLTNKSRNSSMLFGILLLLYLKVKYFDFTHGGSNSEQYLLNSNRNFCIYKGRNQVGRNPLLINTVHRLYNVHTYIHSKYIYVFLFVFKCNKCVNCTHPRKLNALI